MGGMNFGMFHPLKHLLRQWVMMNRELIMEIIQGIRVAQLSLQQKQPARLEGVIRRRRVQYRRLRQYQPQVKLKLRKLLMRYSRLLLHQQL